MLENVTVVLVRPKYPENIGSVARACLNMGCPNLTLVSPRYFEIDRALPLATVHAKHILEQARVVDTLEEAIEGHSSAYGTTARTGGWRKGVMLPPRLAKVVGEKVRMNGTVAIVFGPEDTGMTNEETQLCTSLVTIPTDREGVSLNLSQAALVLLYECFKEALERPFVPDGPPDERLCTVAEQETLFSNLKESLLAIDYLRDNNTDYWMMPVRRFLARISLKRNEFNLLMGICRQVKWIAKEAGRGPKSD